MIKSTVGESTTVAAVLEAPRLGDVTHARPLSGQDGGEWDRALKANGLHRTMIDLFFVVSCAPRDGWKKMEATWIQSMRYVAEAQNLVAGAGRGCTHITVLQRGQSATGNPGSTPDSETVARRCC